MNAVAVKICGLCRPEDAALATSAGASHVGVILSPVGRRYQSVEAAARILTAAGDARRVGVFVDADAVDIRLFVEALDLAAVQLHGTEAPEWVDALRRDPALSERGTEVWKALRPRSGAEFGSLAARYADVADLLLLDGWHADSGGGAGVAFPWDEVAGVLDAMSRRPRLGVAGGLRADNVADAIKRLRPALVDVSSGVEASMGVKSPAAVRAFTAAARAAAGELVAQASAASEGRGSAGRVRGEAGRIRR